jgi:hypothetical protein
MYYKPGAFSYPVKNDAIESAFNKTVNTKEELMKKIQIVSIILLLSLPALFATGVGSGISVFVPESLYTYDEGSVSLEQSLEFSLGLSSILSVPIGINYNTNYGLMVDGEDSSDSPWFYSDALMPYIMLKAHVPFGPVFIELFGGAAANRNLTLRALEGNIENDLSSDSGQAVIEDGTLDFENNWGLGYLAGGSLGVTVGQISVLLTATYRDIRHELNMKADYADISEVNPDSSYDPGEDVILVMRGVSVGIGGNFSF